MASERHVQAVEDLVRVKGKRMLVVEDELCPYRNRGFCTFPLLSVVWRVTHVTYSRPGSPTVSARLPRLWNFRRASTSCGRVRLCCMRSLAIDKSAPVKVAAVKISSPGAGRRPKWGSPELASNACTASEDTWPLLYVPSIIGHHDQYRTEKRGPWFALNGVAQSAQLHLEHRVLRSLVVDKLFPITSIKEATEFKAAVIGIADCLHWLFETVGIPHGNVSVGNLMSRVVDGTVCGVLNDYDLSIVVTENSNRKPTANQCRGTLPFMALDLLENFASPSLLRHDLESLFYCIIWITAQYADGKVVRPEAYMNWARLSVPALETEKFSFLYSPRGTEDHPFPTQAFDDLMGNSIDSIKGMIKDGHLARDAFQEREALALRRHRPFNEEFDFETLGGHVTWETFIDALQS